MNATLAPETGGAKSSRVPSCPAKADRTPTQLDSGGGCAAADGAPMATAARLPGLSEGLGQPLPFVAIELVDVCLDALAVRPVQRGDEL